MARIRTIKPEFFTSLTVATVGVHARLTFIGLWTHVDDDGRCVDDPRLIKAAIWPLDDRLSSDVESDLRELSESSLITRYMVDGRAYLAVNGFAEHQKINRRTDSKLPAPPVDAPSPTPPSNGRSGHLSAAAEPVEASTPPPLTEPSVSPPEPVTEGSRHYQDQDQGSGKGKDHHPHARDETRRLVRDLTGADDDESIAVIEKIVIRHRPANPGGYIRTMHRNGHLLGVLAEVRAERERADTAERRRAHLEARQRAADQAEPAATPEEGAAARAAIRAIIGGGIRTGGEPAAIGNLLGQARSA